MVKPFAFEELCARVRALLRREESLVPQQLQVGGLVLDVLTRQVRRGQRSIELTAKEFTILEYLMRYPNQVITRIMLEQHIWNLELDSSSNLIDAYISRLRRKIDNEGDASLIQTVNGVGYRMATA